MMPLFTKKAKSLMKGDREGASGAFQTPTAGEVGRKPSLCLVDKPKLSERENLTSGRALRYIWGPNNDHYAVSAQEVAQNNSPAKSHSTRFLALPCLLCPWPPMLSKPFLFPLYLPRDGSHRTYGGLITGGGLWLEWSWSPGGGTASSCPGFWREGGSTEEFPWVWRLSGCILWNSGVPRCPLSWCSMLERALWATVGTSDSSRK